MPLVLADQSEFFLGYRRLRQQHRHRQKHRQLGGIMSWISPSWRCCCSSCCNSNSAVSWVPFLNNRGMTTILNSTMIPASAAAAPAASASIMVLLQAGSFPGALSLDQYYLSFGSRNLTYVFCVFRRSAQVQGRK